MFTKFGTIVECKVMVDRYTKVSRQIGFVRFSNVEEATFAMDSMNTLKLDPSTPPLTVKYADTEVIFYRDFQAFFFLNLHIFLFRSKKQLERP